jgi:hypothetical protein
MLDRPISSMKKPLIVASSENFGLARSEFEVSCFACREMISKLEFARSNNIEDNGEVTNKEIEAKHFFINK